LRLVFFGERGKSKPLDTDAQPALTMWHMRRALSALAVALLCVGIPLKPAPAQPGTPSTAPPAADASGIQLAQNLSYGTLHGTELRLDVYQPAAGGGERMAVILIHGGAWNSLDKSTMRPMGQFLARAGFVAFAVDYRLFQNAGTRWPAQLDDVQRAVRWMRANATTYHINQERIGAFGHSAGGQLAALLGVIDTRDNSDSALAGFSSRVQAVVDVDGPVDFTAEHDSQNAQFLAKLLGADYDKKPEVWRDASPVTHVSKDSAPFLIVHGTRDTTVPIAVSQQFNDKLVAAGVPVTFIKVDDEHTFENPQNRRQLALQSLAFFNRYLVTPQ
jgi:acetyl esterase/lipase